MHRFAALLALGAFSLPAAAGWFKSNQETSWAPPRQTGIYGQEAGEQAEIALGWTPVPTDAPKLAGAMDLNFAFGKRDLKPQTCGFGKAGNSFTCISSDATCSLSSGYVGCCETGRSCNLVKTTCVDYAESASICQFLEDFHTLCCGSTAPSCFSWVGTSRGNTYTLLDCSASTGSSSLLFSDPLATESTTTSDSDSSTTDSPSSTSEDASSSTTSEAAATSTDPSNDDDGPNVGAIAGGTVGGVAALALVGLAGFLLFRRRKKATPAATPLAGEGTQNPPPMAQNPQSPGNSFVPSSPSNAAYPSGVPSNFQGSYQQAYDPTLAAPYGQPQGYQQPGYSGYSPQPQGFQGQYPQQGFSQQNQYPSQYGVGGYGAPSTSPPPHFTPSPGPNKDGNEAPLSNQPQHHAQELPAVNPVGNEGNRAELS